MYKEIKKNIIEHFFNKNFKWAYGYSKNAIVDKIKEFCPFDYEYDYKTDELTMSLGDGVVVTFKFKWESRQHTNEATNTVSTTYRLIDIY